MPDFNRPEVYDHIRAVPEYHRNGETNGEPCRYVRIRPDDSEDPTEPRQILVNAGVVRVGYDMRTHKAKFVDGEVIIQPKLRA